MILVVLKTNEVELFRGTHQVKMVRQGQLHYKLELNFAGK